jgi:hypothetical protein
MITGDRLIGRTAVLALLLAGSAAYAEAILAQRISYTKAMALTALVVFSLTAAVTALGRERRGIELGP